MQASSWWLLTALRFITVYSALCECDSIDGDETCLFYDCEWRRVLPGTCVL